MDKSTEYGRIYNEIACGFSKKNINGVDYFFKHPSQAEHFSIYDRYDIIYQDAKNRGLETENEKLERAIAEGWWPSKNEVTIDFLNKTVKNLYKTKEKLLYKSQKEDIQKQILRNERILITYRKQRNEVIGYTLEKYANDKFYDETILKLTYKNEELTQRVFESESDYYYLSEDTVEQIRSGFDGHVSRLNLENVRLVAACMFFQNLIYITDCIPMHFWGKPTVACTKYQIDMLIYGKMFKNIIKNAGENGKPISDEILSDPEKLVAWVDSQSGGSNSKNKQKMRDSSTRVTSHVGATQSDLKDLGVRVEKIGGKSLLQLAEESGGTLEKSDYLNARDKL